MPFSSISLLLEYYLNGLMELLVNVLLENVFFTFEEYLNW